MINAPAEILVWPKGKRDAEWPDDRKPELCGSYGPCHWMGLNAVRYIRADLVEDRMGG